MNSFTTNSENASHQLIKSSQRKILLHFFAVSEKIIYLYKTKQNYLNSLQIFEDIIFDIHYSINFY